MSTRHGHGRGQRPAPRTQEQQLKRAAAKKAHKISAPGKGKPHATSPVYRKRLLNDERWFERQRKLHGLPAANVQVPKQLSLSGQMYMDGASA